MGGRNQALDGLRGIAATAVIFFHCLGSYLSAPPLLSAKSAEDVYARIAVAICNGDTAVTVFFIISGAVLMNSLQRQEGSTLAIGSRFFAERFFRLAPALFAAVLLCYEILFAMGKEPTAWQLFTNLVLYDNALNGPTWTLNAEAIGTLFILAGYFAARRFGVIGLLVVLVIAVTAARHLQPKDSLFWFRWSVLPFAFGMLIPTAAGQAVAARLTPAAFWPALALMIFARHLSDAYGTTAGNISTASAAVVVTLLFYNKAGTIFAARPLVFLGTISYSLYLLNVPLLSLLEGVVPHTLSGALLKGVTVATLTVPVAWASYWWIERPGIELGRQLASYRAPSAISSARRAPLP